MPVLRNDIVGHLTITFMSSHEMDTVDLTIDEYMSIRDAMAHQWASISFTPKEEPRSFLTFKVQDIYSIKLHVKDGIEVG